MKVPSRPSISAHQAAEVASRLFGVEADTAAVRELPSYEGRNFRIDSTSERLSGGCGAILKFAPPGASKADFEFETAVSNRVVEKLGTGRCPRSIRSLDGDLVAPSDLEPGVRLWCRMATWVEGRSVRSERPFSPGLLAAAGRLVGELTLSLDGFDPPHRRSNSWDLRRTLESQHLVGLLPKTSHRRALIETALAQLRAYLPALEGELPLAVIHNDVNDDNLLKLESTDRSDPQLGIIDFGDATHSYRVGELAVALAYVLQESEQPIRAAGSMISSYHHTIAPLGGLRGSEIDALLHLVRARLVLSLLHAIPRLAAEPDNEYLEISQRPGTELLSRLLDRRPQEVVERWRQACDLPSHSGEQRSPTAILKARKDRLGPSLSISYRDPLTIVRGRGQYLYDHSGDAYLDLVNNVCHVGHCHPDVVSAAQRQLAVLNTNTRYLHDHLVEYAERLTSHLPDPLEVCYFVCSGSEANELALRMARTSTGARDLVVIDAAYHGNTSQLIDISPYKADGPGGRGIPSNVLVADLPDSFRGKHRGSLDHTGSHYSRDLERELARHTDQGRRFAAFIGESMLGCGGQIELPVGYLAAVYESIRRRGGVCIADEVQVGFGRAGTHFWAFETQAVVPDIVTLGKPIGNGHPMAAVVTTREIADSFANGMEYFNTFGGNPVSCATGLAVLDVIHREDLQANALAVGNRILDGARALQASFPELGDVRGRGLFLGLEIVDRNRPSTPDADLAAAVAEHMRGERILISTDGPDHNVLKIKPPLVISENDADAVLFALERALTICREGAPRSTP